MFKMMTTLIRSRSYDAAEMITDANALPILRQQLRDAADGLEKSKRSVAVVMAYCARERKNAQRIAGQIADLETRAMSALAQGREDLAIEAASAIADLEAERAAVEKSIAHYDTEITKLREQVSLSEQRLRALQRGKQIADAADRTHRLRGSTCDGVMASLREAESMLDRLNTRHEHADEVEIALTELNISSSAETVSARLAAAGCGAPVRAQAADVLARLRAQVD
ncbi:PspA/IM30 family protein [Tropicibacter naphthalenivorans]|uniref:Phage shock protein A n=1 Tax=Tropicibacter naphthalenivorans TaxID=441103 RepID=A0A0P1G246_9RHOB|nr:PspA/IM30 family protein [Tropicibacter naphthalenivorans]CUH75863.1 phage shock protein A [Tropicibacter naphthalenivorans]SMC41769.1 phage shock protein A (PspA) family protein [Tropicibacter naphthalenivorans]